MIWAAVVIATFGVTLSVVLLYYCAVKLSDTTAEIVRTMRDAHNSTLATLERVHGKNMRQLSEMSDRFMAVDFSKFKTWQAVDDAPEGGFEPPEEGEVRVERPLGERFEVVGESSSHRASADAELEKMLREDFPPGWDES